MLLTTLLSACSAPGLVYNNAPQLVHWWLDGYVDLDGAQSVQVRDALADVQAWHRREELPRLAELLRVTARSLPEPLSAEAACRLYAEVVASGERLSVMAEPAVVALAASLRPEQVRALERKYAKTNADYRSKWLVGAPADLKKRRYEQLLDRVESVYGRLTPPQRALLRQQVEGAAFDPATSYAIRLQHQQDAVAVLRQLAESRPGSLAVRDAMRGVLQRRLHPPEPMQRRYADTLIQDGCAGLAAVHNSTTAAQRAHAAHKLNGYADDAAKLAAR